MNIDKKALFLATCLLESLEDEDLGVAKIFLEKHGCNPNQIITERGIAPIHYASGMENVKVGEEIIELMLNCKGECKGDPNVKSEDGLNPLHVACLTGRPKIVKMLLKHGGDIDARDVDGKTPILYAVHEKHFDVIEVIQNFVFERKIEGKTQRLLLANSPIKPCFQSPRNKNLVVIRELETNKYTPNKVHYNFDVTSPYYINITHRRKTSKNPPLGKNADETVSSPRIELNQNLFNLTEENLSKFSEQLAPIGSRISLIQQWRDKVQQSRRRSSILKVFNNVDELLDGIMSEESLYYGNTRLEPQMRNCKSSKMTPSGKPFTDFLDKLIVHDPQSDITFMTAVDDVGRINVSNKPDESNFLRTPKSAEIVTQVAETYTHTDDENGLVFYETRLYPNPPDKPQDMNKSQCSESTNFTVPVNYDTDALRAELTTFGDVPGPITKSTKKLYIKRLVRYKRNIEKGKDIIRGDIQESKFSVELERSITKIDWFNRIEQYMPLEKEVSNHFHVNGQKRKFREGNMKTSFIYLLIDPRKSKNLPVECKFSTPHEVWNTFLNSVFYVGKGKSSRPYCHLYDAMKIFSKNRGALLTHGDGGQDEELNDEERHLKIPQSRSTESQKLRRILDIWNAGRGVVCLHVFHNIMPAEAYTREAAIIDAFGLKHLTNLKRGDYYGPCQSWTMKDKKYFGIALLFKAMQIFLAEGESQLTPSDLM